MRRFGWVVALMLVPGVAAAQQEHSLAVSHFDRGLEAMKAGKFAEACPALAESYRLDKRPGTLFTLADCETQWGKLASALAHFNDYMEWYDRMPPDQKAAQRGRQDVAPERQRDLRARVPMVTVQQGGPEASVADTVVEIDGTALGAGSIGVPLPVDPGSHELVVKAKGYEPRATKFEIAEREKKELTAEPGNALPPDAGEKKAGAASTNRTLAIAAGGLGVVGLGVGTVFGIITMGHASTIDDNCRDHHCNAEGKDAADASQTTGLLSTVGFAVAGGALAIAAVLWFTARDPKPSPSSTAAFQRPFVVTW